MNREKFIIKACKDLDLDVERYEDRDVWVATLNDDLSLVIDCEAERQIQVYCALKPFDGDSNIKSIFLFMSIYNQSAEYHHMEYDAKYNSCRVSGYIMHGDAIDSISVTMMKNMLVRCINNAVDISEQIYKVAKGMCNPLLAIEQMKA